MAAADDNGPAFTDDTLFGGRLICRQHRHGYRFSVDAVLLAHFVQPKNHDNLLEIGAGCGIVSLLLAFRWPRLEMTALELQPQLAALCRHNVEGNGYGGRIRVVNGDYRQLRQFVEPGSFAQVVANPPFRPPDAGRLSGGAEQAVARHEVAGSLAELVSAVAYASKTRGRVSLVYPAARAALLLAALKNSGLEPKRLQVVHSYPGDRGRLVLVEAVKGGGAELAILPPFYVYNERGGGYSVEMARCYEAGWVGGGG